MPHGPLSPSKNAKTPASAATGGAAAVDRALTILNVFQAGDRAISLATLAQRTGFYKSTILRLLASLEHAGMISRRANGDYQLAANIARLHRVYIDSFSLRDLVQPALRALVASTGESAAYHVRQGAVRLCLYREDSPSPIRDLVSAGDLLPLDRGTGGRVLMAFDPPPALAFGPKERALYHRIRSEGYAAGVGDHRAEVAGISAPIFAPNGGCVAALTLTMPAHRYDPAHIAQVVAAAAALSQRMP